MNRNAVRSLTVAATLATLLAGGSTDAQPRIKSIELGVDGVYRVGLPTLITAEVEQQDGQPLRLLAIAPDNDGLPVATTGALTQGESTETLVSVVTKLGRAADPIVLRLLDESDETLDQRRVRPGSVVDGAVVKKPLAAEERFVIVIGGAETGDANSAEPLEQKVARLADLTEAPSDWRAYQAADRVLLHADEAALGAGDEAPIAALEHWVRRGGRLILSCGETGPTLLDPAGPLANFAPGEPAGVVPLRSTAPLETFAGASRPLQTSEPLKACRLTDVRGQVLCYDGPSQEALPLVVRTRIGFGEVLLVAIDLSSAAISGWQDRAALYDRLMNPSAVDNVRSADPAPNRRSKRTLSLELVRSLDNALPGVTTAPLLAIVGLTTLYLLTIGPLDWLIVTRWLGRPQLTWVTFPITVALFAAAVLIGASWLRGLQCATASLEVRDVDSSTGSSRTLLLTQLYSPRPDRFDLTASVAEDDADASCSWFASVDGRLGGLSSGSGLGAEGSAGGYATIEGKVEGLPLAAGSTKSLVTEVYAAGQPTMQATLEPSTGGLVAGSVTNETGDDLVDCQLWHNGWAWRLGAFGNGETKTINDSGNLLRVTTLLGKQLDERETTAPTLASMISFGRLIDRRRSPPENHLLAHWDVTHQLDMGQAILVGRLAKGADSLRLVGDARTGKAPQQRDVFVRYLIAVSD